ncbi:MAG: bifunctional demethylmenaquinone methyltransferase/2-methoxy-6-polyprenyl-1,4-benzoquinol methylase UbiE [Planctomycetota bacterium]|nr:bifunctional demethylmenaquinone methyltransferase/2-methoxy-6-polyprenyl-1,4-benzoquinol methylase UbiE [Planctomycetota bacterium]
MNVDKSSEKVRNMFGQIAPKYDRMNHLLSMNVDHYWRWYTVRKLKPVADLPILDVCTGTGDLAISFYKKTGGTAEVVATDFCPEMLEFAEKKQKKFPADRRIRFLEADTQELPLADDTFQIVSVAFGLRNVADTLAGLREMVRVCRPGGTVAVLEFTLPRRQPIKYLYQWYFRNVLPRIGQWFASNDAQAYEYLPETVGEFPQYQELANLMTEAGLKDTIFIPLTFGIATLYLGTKP